MDNRFLDPNKSTVQIKISMALAYRIRDLLKKEAERAADNFGKDSISAAFETSYAKAYEKAIDRGEWNLLFEDEPTTPHNLNPEIIWRK